MSDIERRVEEIFQEALDQPSGDRQAFLQRACGDDVELLHRVRELLEHFDADTDGLADRPAVRLGRPQRRITDPERIGPYKILQRLGEGGFGVVYEAEQTEPIRRRVAVKLIKAGMDTESVLARFDAERQALALMDHPHIARVLDAGATEAGRPYFVMELVRGDPITTYCDRERLDLDRRLALFRQVCLAVQHAHQKGVIHRDLKPGNILITRVDGRPVPKVIDFGIAKAVARPLTEKTLHTVQGQVMGTPVYMSPEQAEHSSIDIDTTSDVYSLGVVLYELLTGYLPYDPERLNRADSAEIQRILREEEPGKPSARFTQVNERAIAVARARALEPWTLAGNLKGDLDWVVMRALEKDRSRRYPTALQLANELEAYLENRPVMAGPPGMGYQLKKFTQRHRAGILLTGAVGSALVVGAVTLALLLVESNHQRDLAEEARAEAEAVTAFLSDMLASVDPAEEGHDIAVKDVLDKAGEEIETGFADLPGVQAQLHNSIGMAYRALGEYQVAHGHVDRAYRLRRDLFGEDDLLTLGTGEDLGWIFYDVSEYAAADSVWRPLYETALEEYGEDHEFTLMMMRNVGVNYLRLEQLEGGLEFLERAYLRTREVLGDDDDRTWKVANDYALLLSDLGRYAESESLLVGSLAHDREHHGEEHPETLAGLQNLASIYRQQDRLDEARSMYEQAMYGSEAVYGTDHPHTVRTRHNLALCYSDMQLYDKAEPLSFGVWETRVRTLGRDNPSTIASQLNLALLYLRMEKYEDAKAAGGEASRLAGSTLGENHLYALIGAGTRGTAFMYDGNPKRAEAIFTDVIAGYGEILPEGHWRPAEMRVRRGEARLEQGRFAEAEQDLLLGHRNLEESFEPDHRRVVRATELLIDLYSRWGRPEDAAIWRSRLPAESS